MEEQYEHKQSNLRVENFVKDKIIFDDGYQCTINESQLKMQSEDEDGNPTFEYLIYSAPAKLNYQFCMNGEEVGDDYLLVFDTFTTHPCSACGIFHQWHNVKNDVNLREEYL